MGMRYLKNTLIRFTVGITTDADLVVFLHTD
jgi:hypothetical protein